MTKPNQIICGDAVKILKDFDEDCIDLVVTSPPYDNLRNYNNHVKGSRAEFNGYSFDFENLAQELFRVVKAGGVVVWVVGDGTHKGSETLTSFRQALFFKEIGFNVHDTMIYEKNSISFPSSNRYNQIYEFMFVLSKGKPSTFNPIKDHKNKWAGHKYWGDLTVRDAKGQLVKRPNDRVIPEFSMRTNIWRYNTGKGFSTKDKIAFEHPAIFPEALATEHIQSWSKPGDLVFDPMCGSGTTLKSAAMLGRQYIGIDIDKRYCEIAETRIKEFNKKT